MFRSIIGFAVFAVVALVALKLLFVVLGLAFGVVMTLLIWAAFGYLFYIALRVVSPSTAHRLRDMIRGRSA